MKSLGLAKFFFKVLYEIKPPLKQDDNDEAIKEESIFASQEEFELYVAQKSSSFVIMVQFAYYFGSESVGGSPEPSFRPWINPQTMETAFINRRPSPNEISDGWIPKSSDFIFESQQVQVTT